MSIGMLGNILLILVLVGWIAFRQLSWRPVVISRMWRMPAIMAVIGIYMLSRSGSGIKITSLDIGFLALEVVVSLVIGALMGKIAQFRPIANPDTSAEHPALMETRTGGVGMALWLVMIAVRVGIDVIATMQGDQLASSVGIILILLAANRAARVGVIAYRLDRRASVAA
jgi:hypothetical protein